MLASAVADETLRLSICFSRDPDLSAVSATGSVPQTNSDSETEDVQMLFEIEDSSTPSKGLLTDDLQNQSTITVKVPCIRES